MLFQTILGLFSQPGRACSVSHQRPAGCQEDCLRKPVQVWAPGSQCVNGQTSLEPLLYPRSTKLKGVYWLHVVRLSACGQNRVRSVSSKIHAGSIFIFTHFINQLQRVCCVLSFVTNYIIWIFGNFFKFAHLTCVHVMWMLKVDSSILIWVFIAATFNFPWWYL